MALKKLGPAETREFLDHVPGMLAVVGTLSEDGYPHLVAVWYRYDGEHVYIWTLEKRAWVQNLLRDNRVAISVQEEAGSSRGVSIKGQAEITTGDDVWITQEIGRITRRYLTDEAEVEPYLAAWKHLRTMVTITPERVNAWYDAP